MRVDCGRLTDLDDPGSKGLDVEGQRFFIIRLQNQAFAYLNRCPHMGVELDFVPDRFLTLERDYIQCSLHAALFTLNGGHCVYGPCNGSRLTPLPLEVIDGQMFVQLPNPDTI